MSLNYFFGIDISKGWLDIALVKQNRQLLHQRIENTPAAIKECFRQLKKQTGFSWQDSLFCMEHTGIYNHHLMEFLFKKKAPVWLESGLQIKQSLGVQRGKNDKVDAARIAFYAYKNREDVRLWEPEREVVQKLRRLTTIRSRLVGVIKQLKTPLQEEAGFKGKRKADGASLCSGSLKAVEKDLAATQKAIDALIASDQELSRLFALVNSVQGVGKVTAVEVILSSNEFKDITDARKFACYSGVAPFEHRSGSSVRGKSRVSSLGNKSVKSLLHLAAMAAIGCNQELKAYYQRKVAEGKNKMLVLNAVRNKLIHRIFACVKQNRKYEKNYQQALA